ncbi:lipopolysaccharide biosynthesis protein [Caballeronia sp. BR00000012568055]|uniref:lipopolysaccharide biosynthesis protein n=1 Tax=Caballeronia sp. BR00000012568055 TaxID=2918761 RepID=UPI0023F855FD|nr:lipopolysaccharide biosynthesis protein [Caballeronia sp. BR00000012568055]
MTNRTQADTSRFQAFYSSKVSAIAAAVVASVMLAACGGGSDSAVDAATGKAATPKATAKAANNGSIFYGLNGHNSNGAPYDTTSIQTQLSQLQDLGATIYRNDVYSQASAQIVAKVAQQMAAGGVTVYPVLMLGLDYNSEDDAYNAGYTLGQQTANSYHYGYYEVGNELEAKALAGNYDGNNWQHYNNWSYMLARGVIRGMIAGVKSVDGSAKIIVGGTWKHTAFFQMLADGSQPDGSWGHPTVSWDITSWHWYSNEGDITYACGGTGCQDVLATLQQMGKPIWINEFGVRPDYGSIASIASYLTGSLMMQQYVNIASKYNIQSIQAFELYDDGEGEYGLLQGDGQTQKPAYSAYKNFVQSHPM